MAFNFIKKVFSFGKKQAEESAAPAAEVLPPLRQPEPVETDPIRAEFAAEPAFSSPEPEPAPTPAKPAPVPETPPTEPVTPEPGPAEVPQPAPAIPPAEPVPQQQPVEVPTPPAEPARPPEPERPEIEPAIPEPAPSPAPVEIPPPSAPPEQAPDTPPTAEILPPLRQPEPFEPDPIRAEIAPEPAPFDIPTPQTAPHPPASFGPFSPLAQAEGRSGNADHPLPPPLRGEGEGRAPDLAGPAPASQSTGAKVTVAKRVEQKAEAPKPSEPAPRTSWFQRLKQGLSRSSKELSGNIAGVFTKRKLDEDTLQDLEDVLIRADLGMETAIRVTDALASGRYGKNVSDEEVRTIMAEEVEKVLKPVAVPLELDLSHKPHVVLVVGVNGTGKTTTIGKLAAKLVQGGLSVTLAAGDTFRAAAIEQLKIWGERTGSPVVSSKLGADAAGLAYDAFEKAKEAGSDVLIIDTAGRLQNKTELMAELEKIVRVLGKLDPEAPHTVLQTVDATTGQNALNQVEIFRNVAGVNGLVMTKLDGTARGGILVAIAAKHRLPVYFIGVGEQVDDLEPFSASDFAKAIAGVA